MALKMVWLVKKSERFEHYSISFESKEPRHVKLSAHELTFPENPTITRPLRHTISLGIFNIEDIEYIHKELGTFLRERRLYVEDQKKST